MNASVGIAGGYSSNQNELPPFIEFFSIAVEDREKTIDKVNNPEGKMIFRDVDMVRMRQRGSKDSSEREVESFLAQYESYAANGRCPADWPVKYREAYARWKKDLDPIIHGTDLRNGSLAISKAQVENLRTMGVLSIEELATVNDETIRRIGMGGATLRERARAWLDANKGQLNPQEIAALREEIKAKDVQLADLGETIKALQADIAELKRKR